MNNIESLDQFPRCKTCGKIIVKNVTSFRQGFGQIQYCCAKCRANNPEYKKKFLENRMTKFGNIFGDIKKIVTTRISRHGRKNPKLSESLKKAYRERKTEI